MSVIRLQRRLAFGLLFLLVVPLGCLLLVVAVLLVLALMLGLYRNQSSGPHSLYIRNFNIIGVL